MHRCLNEKGIISHILFVSLPLFVNFIPPFMVQHSKSYLLLLQTFFRMYSCLSNFCIRVWRFPGYPVNPTHFPLLLFTYDECIYCWYYFWHFSISHFCYPAGSIWMKP
ncbi:hypothetical protein I7I48_08523 [Histoplasma ohiense]|nr:hypothetical protein I7I48_08523 [Histoplasma ohiense (nom. inval.)]